MESKKYTLNSIDWKKVGTGFSIALAGAGLTYATQFASDVDFGQYTPLVVAILSALVNLGRKYLADKSDNI